MPQMFHPVLSYSMEDPHGPCPWRASTAVCKVLDLGVWPRHLTIDSPKLIHGQ